MSKIALQELFEKVIHCTKMTKWITFVVRRNNRATKIITELVITDTRPKLLFYIE
jgi:hypothetical protein